MELLKSQSRPNKDVRDTNHILHLYTPQVDKCTIQVAFLASIPNGEEAVYVSTVDKPKGLIRELNPANAKLRIIKLKDLTDLRIEEGSKTRIVIDAGSITNKEEINKIEQREYRINELSKKHSINCLCTYDVSKLNPDTINRLSTYHNKLRLTTNDLTVLSGDFIDKSEVSDGSIKKMVKDNLDTIILALLQEKPMCGIDIIETIHLEFNVLLSPGTIYPLLHSLKERGLLKFNKYGKAKTYTPAEDAKPRIRSILNEQIQTRNLLNRYLQRETKI